ncbi:MAG: von Willebrand factor type A domain-containing protein [Planctomycetota bacterium]|nr:von Willebrand factor type A domain-containing protein [Planctomycetota bacterium]
MEAIRGYRFIQDGPRAGAEEYAAFADNPFLAPQKAPLSTFGVDVDTASYANVRRFLTNGQLPPPQAVRIEEMLNYFRYDDPAPQGNVPFSVTVEMSGCPWKADHRLVRIGLAGREIPKGDRPAANLVFLIDVSGSMQSENKLPLVKHSLKLLLSKLDERDRLAIVTYSDTAKVVMPSTVVANRDQIQTTIDSLVAAGSTNGADGIRLAYNEAVHHFVDKGINRVVLCTDGDFNVGTTNDDELVKLIEERRRSQVFFSVYGYGMGNLKDGKLEKLADHGNGHYGYIDGPVEAQKSFVEDAEANLVTIAQDVKIQVEFNPTWVGAYRLIGYENRVMAAADFRNDKVDAGDIGAGHRVTALYEIVPPSAVAEVSSEERPKLRYSTPQTPAEGPLAHETLAVRLRYKTPGEETSKEFEVQYIEDPRPVSKNMQWSSAVAAFGLLLRQSPHRGEVSIPMILELAEASVGEDPQGHRHEFVELVRKAAPAFTHQPAASVKTTDIDRTVTAADAERTASMKGKYSNLLRVIRAEGDREVYGEVSEYGLWEGRDYQDHTNLPQGYWVYVAPNWYIWGDLTK